MTVEPIRSEFASRSPLVERLAGPRSGEPVTFTFGTLVTNHEVYSDFRLTLEAGGFTERDCEFLIIDNSKSNRGDGYRGLNAILDAARGTYVVLCHQDLLLIDPRRMLEQCLAELDARDTSWAVAGNAGGRHAGEVFLHITGVRHGEQRAGVLPQRIFTLDENFMVVRAKTGVRLSEDLTGFHLYGADLCLNADQLGYSSYVIDYHLKHLGSGGATPEFLACRQNFQKKWSPLTRYRAIQTPCTFMFLNPVPWRLKLLTAIERSYYRVQKKLARRRIRREMRTSTV